MKITRIKIKDFAGINADLKLEHAVNVFFGFNSSGKSLIFDAIYWCYRGKIEQRGMGYMKDWPLLGKEPTVQVDAGDKGLIRRKGKGGSLEDWPDEQLRILLNPATVLTCTPTERQRIFASLLRQGSTDAAVRKICQENGIEALAERIIADPEAVQKKAVEQRREEKRELKEQQSLSEPSHQVEIAGEQADLTKFTPEQVEWAIEKSRRQLYAWQNQPEPIDGKALAAQRDECQKELDSVGGVKKLQTEITKTKARIETLSSTAHRTKNYQSEIVARLQYESDSWETFLQDAPNECPTCHQSISEDFIAEVTKGYKERTAKLDVEHDEIAGKVAEILNKKAPLVQEYDKLTERLTKSEGRFSFLSEKIADLNAHIKKAKTQRPLSDNSEEIVALEDQLKNRDELLRHIKDYQQKQKAFAATQSESTLTQKKIEQYDLVDHLLKPGGAIRLALNADVEKAGFDDVLGEAWKMTSLKLTAEGAIALHERPLEMASRSEQWRAGILVAELLARQVGFPWLLLDGVDILADTRSTLQDRLLDWEHFDSVLINASVKQRPEISSDDVGVFWVDDKKIMPLAI